MSNEKIEINGTPKIEDAYNLSRKKYEGQAKEILLSLKDKSLITPQNIADVTDKLMRFNEVRLLDELNQKNVDINLQDWLNYLRKLKKGDKIGIVVNHSDKNHELEIIYGGEVWKQGFYDAHSWGVIQFPFRKPCWHINYYKLDGRGTFSYSIGYDIVHIDTSRKAGK